MSVGAFLRDLRDEDRAEEALLSLGDLILLAEVEAVRQSFGESAGEYVAAATQRFANLASDDDWLQLMTRLERADDHAAVCLGAMLRWAISVDKAQIEPNGLRNCAHGSGGHHGHGA